jgi:stearoyl-CoA desaturase (delta-9 desaturase)
MVQLTRGSSRTIPRLTVGQWLSLVGVVAIHVGAVLAFVRGMSWGLVGLAVATYVLRMFGITVGYHRYFSHRSFQTGRVFQFVLAFIGSMAAQKGPLWWAALHRIHHRHADTERDVHSPVCGGFWHAYFGWWWGREHEATRVELVRDFMRFPELRFLDRYHALGSLTLMGLLLAFGGLDALLWGYCLSTVMVNQAIFGVNSIGHLRGARRYATHDTSRNHVLLGVLGCGEGWHNNHHHHMSSARLGFYWWEIDLGYLAIKACDAVGLVSGVRTVSPAVMRQNLVAEVGERFPLLAGRNRKDAAGTSSHTSAEP